MQPKKLYFRVFIVYVIIIGALLWSHNIQANDTAPLDIIFIDMHLTSMHKYTEFEEEGEQYSINQSNFGLGITFPVYDHLTGKVDPQRLVSFGLL